ncbi:hypothetical protein [Zobellia laminariae]|uniref:hypothetical protein n=1 Tax=Zobellia laminariae TaxID=248906 RepID=UPI004056F206
MKNSKLRLGVSMLTVVMFSLLMINCSDDDSSTETEKEAVAEYIVETKANLLGEWVLISSSINNEIIASSEFEVLKDSRANFNVDNTYSLVYKTGTNSAAGSSISTNTQEGTYTIEGLNKVTFFDSSSEIELIDDTLKVTSEITDASGAEQARVDIFVRSDNEALNQPKESNTDEVKVEEETETPGDINTFDGTAVIAKLLGKWELTGVTDPCLMKNTIDFQSDSAFEFVQHKTTFGRSDLLKYNIGVSYPMPAEFAASVTKGNETVVFNTNADCSFIKTSLVEYEVTDEKTVELKKSTSTKLVLENDTTLTLIYTYLNTDNEEATIEFTYVKS